MSTLTLPYTLSNGTTADGAHVQADFDAVAAVVNALDSANITDYSIAYGDLAKDATGLGVGSFHAYCGTSPTITANTPLRVPYDTEEWDLSGWHDATSTKGRYTPLVKGIYRLSASVDVSNITSGQGITLTIRKNGSDYRLLQQRGTSGVAVSDVVSGSTLVDANGTTDYFEAFVTYTAASSAIGGGATLTYFEGELVVVRA